MSFPTVPSFRQLLVFEAVARTENVSRAAAAIHVSQPAVTQAIARLEHEVGAALFRRRNTGCYLTHAGEILQRRTARLFTQLDQALTELGLGLPRVGASDLRSVERRFSQPQMRALLAIAANGSFAAAARALTMSEASIHRAARAPGVAGARARRRGDRGIAGAQPRPRRARASAARRRVLRCAGAERARRGLSGRALAGDRGQLRFPDRKASLRRNRFHHWAGARARRKPR